MTNAVGIRCRCGHEDDFIRFDRGWAGPQRPRYQCPACGVRWYVAPARKPEMMPSGFVMPAQNTVVVQEPA